MTLLLAKGLALDFTSKKVPDTLFTAYFVTFSSISEIFPICVKIENQKLFSLVPFAFLVVSSTSYSLHKNSQTFVPPRYTTYWLLLLSPLTEQEMKSMRPQLLVECILIL